jgi:hypothetical protein
MLFDLRGRGRRRTIQGIYLTLAVLMGGGLVFFGIGGNTSGGLFDAFKGNGGGGGTNVFAKQIKTAERQVKVNPNDMAAWAALAKARFGDAGQGENYDRSTQAYTDKGRKTLQDGTDAFKRYLLLNKGKADLTLANQALQAIVSPGGVNDAVTGTTAARIVAEARPSANTYYQLAQLAYKAGDKRTGDLASAKTLELAPPGRKSQVKLLLDQAKNPSAAGNSSAAGAGAASTP